MNALQNRILEHFREDLERHRNSLALWREGKLSIKSNGKDITGEHLADLESIIAELEGLIRQIEAGEL